MTSSFTGDLEVLIPGLHEEGGCFAILTFARIWMTVTTVQFVTKDEAADWALARLPRHHQTLLKRARAIYLGEEDDRWDGHELRSQLQPYADHLIAEITRAS